MLAGLGDFICPFLAFIIWPLVLHQCHVSLRDYVGKNLRSFRLEPWEEEAPSSGDWHLDGLYIQ